MGSLLLGRTSIVKAGLDHGYHSWICSHCRRVRRRVDDRWQYSRHDARRISVQIYDHVEALEYTEAHWLSATMVIFSFVVLLALYTFNRRTKKVRGD